MMKRVVAATESDTLRAETWSGPEPGELTTKTNSARRCQ